MRRAVLAYCILNMLSSHVAYVVEILEALKKAEVIVQEGTIYPLMTRLKDFRLLSYPWEEATGGPPRKYYGLTPQGEVFLMELEKTWSALQTSVATITQPKNQQL